MDRNYDVITFFQKTFILRRPRVAIFADIIKIVTMFTILLKQSLKFQEKLEEIEIMYLNEIYICISWYSWFPVKNADVTRTQWGVSRDSYSF